MSRVDWPRVDASLAELLDPAAIDAAVDEGLRLGDLRFRRTLRLLQAVAVTAVVVVTGAALMLQGSVHAESEHPPPPPSHALPVVQSVFPAAGSHEGGLTVSVRGLHLGDVDTVFFGDTAVSDLEKVSDDAVFVVTPAHEPGPVPVTVVAGGEKSRANPSATFTFLPTSAAPGPRLTELSPDSGPDTGGTEVTVWGSRLDGASAVSFGESRVGSEMFLAASDTSITLRTPSRDAGPVEVTVTTDAGTSGPLTYTYTGESPPGPTDEIPVVKSVDPTSGSVDGGEKVTVSGANLADATAVEFGGVGATITSQDEGMITVLTPEQGAGEVAVVVKSPAGESVASPAARYTYEAPEVVPPPEVTGIEPDEGPTAGLQLVTIRGSGLAQATSVVFGGTEVTELGSSESSITLITPEHRPGPVEVTVTTQGGTSAASYLYVAQPTISELDPAGTCPYAAPPVVTITGSGFFGPDGSLVEAVRFGDRTATVTGDPSGGQIQVVAPSTPSDTLPVTVLVTVTTVGGTSGSLPFTYDAENCVG